MAATLALEASAERREGSTPFVRTRGSWVQVRLTCDSRFMVGWQSGLMHFFAKEAGLIRPEGSNPSPTSKEG